MKKIIILSMLVVLTSCGGGSNSGTTSTPVFSSSMANMCANPRPNTIDQQGTADNEKAYLSAFVNQTYLWYQQLPTNLVAANYATPQDYFAALKTTALDVKGIPVDQFHWSQTTASWDAQSSGNPLDFGIQWAALNSAPPRNWIVADVAPGSPAAAAGIQRGAKLTSIDGIDFVNDNVQADINALNAALLPGPVATHSFGFNGQTGITMTSTAYPEVTVKHIKIIPTTNGNVGYFIFDTQIAQSEAELTNAINQLKAAGISDLIIDLRYNGGGLLYIASELAYMIAGPVNTTNHVFEKLIYNDKLTSQNTSYPFYSSGTANQTLPTLGLNHVSLLVTYGTASASESIINSLRGVNLTVDLIGSTTRGKPYGFVPQGNCGWTYFSIQFKGVNDKGFGDYADGFTPTCQVPDDFTHQRGDTAETMLSSALSYRTSGVCPAIASVPLFVNASSSNAIYQLVRPATKEMRIVTPLPHSMSM
ncbi:S41 family peptidase [Undibacterium sp. RuRC25W]|uniref:S41 family peptidase n=1 Tax=Undibacterium sp. RuRC25W TaxID=3413047 RepID=UPI003BF1EFDA